MALVVCARGACAQPDDPWALLQALPARVDAAVVVDRAADQLDAPPGRALSRLVDDTGMFAETTRAWRELAGALQLDDARALHALLGQRLTVIVDFESPAFPMVLPTARWALVTEVDQATAARLRESLNASPRALKSGVPVLAVENGRFELAVVRRRGASGGTLVLAPASAGSLLDAAIDAVVNPPTSVVPDAARTRAARALGPGPIVGFLRAGAVFPSVGDDAVLAWRAEQTGRGWSAKVFESPCEGEIATASITREAFDVIARQALVAVLIPESPDAISQIMRVPVFGSEGAPDIFRGAMIVAARDSQQPEPAGPFALDVVLGLTDSAPYAQFDAFMGATLVPFDDQRALPDVDRGAVLAGPSFMGRFPEATRVQAVRLEPVGLAQVVGQRAEVAWRYANADGHDFAAVSCAPEGAPSTASDLATTSAEALEAHACNADGLTGLIAAGVVRPRQLYELLAGRPQRGSVPRALRWVDTVRWSSRADSVGIGGIQGPRLGEVELEMAVEGLDAPGDPGSGAGGARGMP